MRVSPSLVNILVVNVLLVVSVQVFLIGSVPAFGWDSLQFWLPQSHMTLAGESSTEYQNGRWTHPQPRTLIDLISACTKVHLPYQYVWFVAAMSFCIAAIRGIRRENANLIIYIAFTGMIFSVPLWESHVVIVGYADLLVAVLFGFALKFARSALVTSSKLDFLVFGVICCALPLIKNTGMAYALLLTTTLIQARYISALPYLNAALMLLMIMLAFHGPSIIEAFNPNFHFSYAGNDLVPGNYSAMDIAKNWWTALFSNMSFSILPILTLVVIYYIFSVKHNPEIYLPVFAIINLFCLLSASQWFEYGFVHALPVSDTGNSRFFLPVVASMVFIVHDILTAYNLKATSQ